MLSGPEILPAILKLVAVLAACGILATGLMVFAMALSLLSPPRMRGGRAMYLLKRLTPSDLGLPYRDMNFTVRDHHSGHPLRIAGWWIDAAIPSDRTIILIHGYSDSKIGGIAWAPLMRSLGFNILAVDLRAHGESQGRFISGGFHERYDISQTIDQLKTELPGESRRIALLGVSLGAAVAVATASLRTDISAVILECPYIDFPSAVYSHAERLPVPGRFFQQLAMRICARLAAADFSQVRPVNLIRTVKSALWIVQVTDDPFVSEAHRRAIAESAAARSPDLPPAQIWTVEGSFHVLALADHPDEYRRRLADFLDKVMPPTTERLLPHA